MCVNGFGAAPGTGATGFEIKYAFLPAATAGGAQQEKDESRPPAEMED